MLTRFPFFFSRIQGGRHLSSGPPEGAFLPVITRPPKPPGHERPVDFWFDAVRCGDRAAVESFLASRLSIWPAVMEAAINLATRTGQPIIRKTLERALAAHLQENRKKFGNRTFELFDRIIIPFNQQYYHDRLMLETWMDNHPVGLRVCYRTRLEFPYLAERLVPLGGEPFQHNILFRRSLDRHSPQEIAGWFESVYATLQEIGNKQHERVDDGMFHPLREGLSTYFAQRAQGFPTGSCWQSDYKPPPASTWESWLLFDAVSQCDFEATQQVLAGGASPNLFFCDWNILSWAAIFGAKHVFETGGHIAPALREKNLYRIIKILLEYGARPDDRNQDNTLMEYLVRDSEHTNASSQAIHREILRLLSASPWAGVHIDVHASLAEKQISQVVIDANRAMKKRDGEDVAIAAVSYAPEEKTLTLHLQNGETLTVTSIPVASLDAETEARLCAFFCDSETFSMEPATKREYFQKTLLHGVAGQSVVDCVHHNGRFVGYVITEVVPFGDALICHEKLALLTLPPSCFGVSRILMWARGFAAAGFIDTITYCEAVSARGFSGSEFMARYPLVPVLCEKIQDIIKAVYAGDCEDFALFEGRYYARDAFDVMESRKAATGEWPTLSRFVRESWEDIYRRPGYSLCIAFPNDAGNRAAFTRILQPVIKPEVLEAFLRFYQQDMLSVFESIKEYAVDTKSVLP